MWLKGSVQYFALDISLQVILKILLVWIFNESCSKMFTADSRQPVKVVKWTHLRQYPQ